MAGISVRREIEAPVERVFGLASDFENAARTITAIQRIEMLTPGPVRIGTRFKETRRMFGREASEEMEVVAFEPPNRYVLLAKSHGCRYDSELTFTPSGSGTEVEMRFEATPLSFMAKVMSVVMSPMMRKALVECVKKDLDDLKAAAEVTPSATSART